MAKVEQVLETRNGTSQKTGKPYTLYKVVVDGKQASSFDPLDVGDEVDLVQNGNFWNASKPKLVANTGGVPTDVVVMLNEIKSELGVIKGYLKLLLPETENLPADMPGDQGSPEDDIDLADIPF